MSQRIVLDDANFMIEVAWEFVESTDIASKSRKKGGVSIKGANALQFAEGDGENGVFVLAAWATDQVSNGIVMLPLPEDRCWVCGVLAGLVAPETDRIVANADLEVVLDLLEDIVPDERYMIQSKHISLADSDVVACSEISIPHELEAAHILSLGDLKDAPKINGFRLRDLGQIRKVGFALIAVSCVGIAGYMGYNWWMQQQTDQQQTEMAADMQHKAMLDRQRVISLADGYRDSHQAMNMYQGVRNALTHFTLNDSGWAIQRVVVNNVVKVQYKRKNGFLASFLEGKDKVVWSSDGGSAELSRDFTKDLPVPMRSLKLQVMDDIRAITLMQKIGTQGVQAGLLKAAPQWASSAPSYSILSGISNIYWKVAVPFSRFESAMALLQHSNVAVGEVELNFSGKTCSIEGMIYVSKG